MGFNIKDISFHYGEHKVLDSISLELKPGKFYGIVGPNGCGKTTFLDLLVKNRKPSAGSILFQDKNIDCYAAKKLARHIALVPQQFNINFSYTAREIVMMGRYPHIPRFASPSVKDIDLVDSIMEKTGIDKFKDRLITEVSGGERQRIVFARALAQNASVLILDEATSNLDINHSINLLNIVAADILQNGKTAISVFQDINLAAMFCEHLVFFKQGRIVCYGPTDEVLNEKTIKSVFNVASKVEFASYANARQVVFKR